MALIIPVPVLWGDGGQFLNDALVNVNGISPVVGTVSKPAAVYPPAMTNPTMKDCLQVNDPTFGALYLDITLAAWQALIKSLGTTAGGVTPKIAYYTAAGTTNTITDANLSGVTLLLVFKGGVVQNVPSDVSLSGDVLTFSQNLQSGDIVGYVYYI